MNASSSSPDADQPLFKEIRPTPGVETERAHYCHPENHKRVHWAAAERQPSVDIEENQQEYLITVELPGVSEEDLKVVFQNGQVHIIVETSKTAESSNGRRKWYLRHERVSGSCHRIFVLPPDALIKLRREELSFGLLKIWLPKRPERSSPSENPHRSRLVPRQFVSNPGSATPGRN